MRNDEIKKLDLAEFAVRYYGFSHTEKSTMNSPSLKNAKGDHIVCKYYSDGGNSFFDPTDNARKGDIYNFVMWQESCDFKAAAAKIRDNLGMIAVQNQAPIPTAQGEKKEFDRDAAKKLIPIVHHAYLEEERCIPGDLLAHGRFKGTIMTDTYHNAVFPHYDKDGEIVGYVKKNRKFNGFSEGGEKLLWKSNQFKTDTKLVVCEAAIDALSIAAMTANCEKMADVFFHTRYVSIDGGLSPEAEALLKEEVRQMPKDAVIEAAFDHDSQGEKYTEKLRLICEECGDKKIQINTPKKKKDWNEVLVAYVKRQAQINAVYGYDQRAPVPSQPSAPAAPAPSAAPQLCTEKMKDMIRDLTQQGYINNMSEALLSRLSKSAGHRLITAALARQSAGMSAYNEPQKKTTNNQQAMSL